MKKYKYRVKDLADAWDVFKCNKVVQVKKWYGWVTIKEFPVYYLNDGTVKLTEPEFIKHSNKRNKHYVDICIEELLDTLNADV